jgi:superfamily I DNA/RNA helicase
MQMLLVKRLELDNVFLVSLVDDTLPSYRINDLNLRLGEYMPPDGEHVNEEARIFYVACTRPRKRLYLYYYEYTCYAGRTYPVKP